MKKLILLMLLPLILCDCVTIGTNITGQYSDSQYLIQKYVAEEQSVDELCQILEEVNDPVVNLTCDDNEEGKVKFTKWGVIINFLFPFPFVIPARHYNVSYDYDVQKRLFKKNDMIDRQKIEKDYEEYLKQKESNVLKDFFEFYLLIKDFQHFLKPEEPYCISCWN